MAFYGTLCAAALAMGPGIASALAMQVFVETPKPETITLEIESSDTIDNLLAKIQDKAGYIPEEQTLYFGSTLLASNFTVSDYGINREDTLALLTPPTDVTVSTTAQTLTVAGRAGPGYTVSVSIDAAVTGTVTADPLSGAWELSRTVAPGVHAVTARQADSLARAGLASAPVTATVDAPATPVPAPDPTMPAAATSAPGQTPAAPVLPPTPTISGLRASARCVSARSLALRFSFELSQPASVTYTLKRRRQSPGRRRCMTFAKRRRGSYQELPAQTGPGRQGHNTVGLAAAAAPAATTSAARRQATLKSLARRRSLAPGTYVLLVRATDALGRRSNDAQVKFLVLDSQ